MFEKIRDIIVDYTVYIHNTSLHSYPNTISRCLEGMVGMMGIGETYGQLGPDLGKDTDVGPVDHVWLEELEVCHVCVVALEFAHVLDVLQFSHDEG